MSEPEPTTPESAATSTGESPPEQRISNPRPKKSAKSGKPEKKAGKKAPAPSFPVFPSTEAAAVEPKSAEWPEPEPATAGDAPPQEGSKRKRRRKKGKGGHKQFAGDAIPVAEGEATQTPPPARSKVDPEKVVKLARKIYLAEVSEEGVALIGDNDAKELSRRCFRLAEIFIEEESRRR
jgi:hypothetical protein